MTPSSPKPRIVILGGGMAGLTTAWELTSGNWRERYDSIRLYQRGWRLGGKGASSRGPNSRIEEHGLHVLLGYYQDTFRVMADCYRELDRPRRDPGCPIQTWNDAVKPAATVGLTESSATEGWQPWSIGFPQLNGMPGSRESLGKLDVAGLALQSLRLLAAFFDSSQLESDEPAAVTVSATPPPPFWVSRTAAILRRVGLTALAATVELTGRAQAVVGFAAALEVGLDKLRQSLYQPLSVDVVGRATFSLVDLAMTNLVGIVRDRLLMRPDGLGAIDDLDYRDWLSRHGAAPETLDSAIIRGMYDLVFAYRDGDPAKPAFSAGLGLELATHMLFDYDGSLFWKMQAGMGEVIFAPLYQVLTDRGVDFEFFHRVDELTVDGDRIGAVRMGRQAQLLRPDVGYLPLVDAGGLPAWPDRPKDDLLAEYGTWLDESESLFGARRDVESVELCSGVDFDVVVFAASLGMVPEVCGQLLAADPRWRAMVENIGTVATQAFQVWLTDDEQSLGWTGGAAVTLSGFADPFDTWASMTHLLEREEWPAEAGVRSIAYFCGSMADEPASGPEQVKERAIRFLNNDIGALWPRAVAAGRGFRWELLAAAGDAADPDASGTARFDSQYWRANNDPSDRYVQSLPGTDRYRLSPGDTGFANLVIAGDWTDSGLNAGCVEAATRSGILAAAAVANRAQQIAEEYV